MGKKLYKMGKFWVDIPKPDDKVTICCFNWGLLADFYISYVLLEESLFLRSRLTVLLYRNTMIYLSVMCCSDARLVVSCVVFRSFIRSHTAKSWCVSHQLLLYMNVTSDIADTACVYCVTSLLALMRCISHRLFCFFCCGDW